MKRQRIAEQWNSFARAALPPDATATQRSEMRRAFYAGAVAYKGVVMEALDPSSGPTDADLRMMVELDAELMEFGAAVAEGRA